MKSHAGVYAVLAVLLLAALAGCVIGFACPRMSEFFAGVSVGLNFGVYAVIVVWALLDRKEAKGAEP